MSEQDRSAAVAALARWYLLAGLLFCSHCGKRHLGTAAKGNRYRYRYRYRYYTCFTKQRYGNQHCVADRLPADQLEQGVLRSPLGTLASSDLIEQGLANTTADTNDRRAAHTKGLAALEREITENEDTATVPALPDNSVLDTIRADIQAAADTGSTEAVRSIMQAFVYRVTSPVVTGLKPRS